MNLKEDRGWE